MRCSLGGIDLPYVPPETPAQHTFLGVRATCRLLHTRELNPSMWLRHLLRDPLEPGRALQLLSAPEC